MNHEQANHIRPVIRDIMILRNAFLRTPADLHKTRGYMRWCVDNIQFNKKGTFVLCLEFIPEMGEEKAPYYRYRGLRYADKLEADLIRFEREKFTLPFTITAYMSKEGQRKIRDQIETYQYHLARMDDTAKIMQSLNLL